MYGDLCRDGERGVLGGLLIIRKKDTPNATFCDDPQFTEAFELVNGMQAQGLKWGNGYREFGREAIGAILRR